MTLRSLLDIELPDLVLNQTPKVELGELATPVCFELAKRLKKAPKAVAQELIAAVGNIPGVMKIEIAGAGYINFFLDRAATLREAFDEIVVRKQFGALSLNEGKIIVEHTNINPNKAAHLGHLRNSTIGDTFVRVLKACGRSVEVQNYIDNTGVQVADVAEDQTPFERRYDPSHPDADPAGFVSMPNVKVPEEMTDMMSASRAYQASLTAITIVNDMVRKALDLGR